MHYLDHDIMPYPMHALCAKKPFSRRFPIHRTHRLYPFMGAATMLGAN